MRHIPFFCLFLLFSSFSAQAQICTNLSDSCVNACYLGILPAPNGTCQQNVAINYLGASVSFSLTSAGAFADFPYIFASPTQDYPASDVWYKMTVTGNQLFFTFSSTQILNPNIAIYKGNACYNFQAVYFGKGANGLLADTVNYLSANQTYYIQISGNTPLEKGAFSLTLQNNNKCDECLQEAIFETIPPNTAVTAGDTVEFSFTVLSYSHAINNNWLHGVELLVGAGWDSLSVTPTQIPSSCIVGNGVNWDFYPTVTGGIFNQTYKRGFYYDSNAGGPLDGNPGNNFGDFEAGQGAPPCSLTYKWKMVALQGCGNLKVRVNTLSDSESGSWTGYGCVNDRKPSLCFGCGNDCMPLPSMTGTKETCAGYDGTATAVMLGGTAPYQYVWYDEALNILATTTSANANTLPNLNSLHQYFVHITDATGCQRWGSMIVYPNFLPLTAQITTQDAHCFGGSDGAAMVLATGGTGNYTYSWATACGNVPLCSNLSAGQYQVIVVGGIYDVCTDTVLFVLNEPAMMTGNINILQAITCNAAAIGQIEMANMLGGTPPYLYSWNTNPPQFTPQIGNLAAGMYSIMVTDSNNCVFVDSISLSQPSVLSLNLQAQVVSCFGGNNGSLTAYTTGGTSPYSYVWAGFGTNGNTLNNLISGNYSCEVTDSQGCTATATVNVTDGNLLLLTTNIGNVSCFGGNDAFINAQISGGNNPYSYSWVGTNQTTANVAGLLAGMYDLWVTDSSNCAVSQMGIVVSQPNSPLVSQMSSTNTSCNNAQDGSINLNILGGTSPYTSLWTPNILNFSQVLAGNYFVSITDANACVLLDTVTISEPLPLVLSLIQAENAYCNLANGYIEMLANGGTSSYSYTWNTVPTQNNVDATNLYSGTYTLTAADANGCKDSLISAIINIPPAVADFTSTPNNSSSILLSNATIQFDNLSTGASTFVWDFGDGNTSTSFNPQHTYQMDSVFLVSLVADNGYNTCPSTDTMTFWIIPNGAIRLASAFTPNNDGYNDFFSAIGSGIVSFEMTIFDRWGRKIFTGNDLVKGWNGKSVSGEDAPEGVYTYLAKAVLNSGKYEELAGTITLIR